MESIKGDVLTKERVSKRDVEIVEGVRGGIEYRATQVPLDYYLRRKNIEKHEYYAGDRIHRDFYISGQLSFRSVNLDTSGGASDKRAYLPATQMQRDALDNYREAMNAIKGKVGQLMILNVCCYGEWLKDINYSPYKGKQSMPRFREALCDLVEFYDALKKSIDVR